MKKKWVFLFLIVCICLSIVKVAYDYYAVAPERPIYSCHHHESDTLKILIIGDSWAYFHQPYDSSLGELLYKKTERPVQVVSNGLCGKTSKEVYLSLFEDKKLKEIVSRGADYCFISVGINDSYKKIGASYYARHTISLIRFFLRNHVNPIILEIPNYDIAKAYKRQTNSRKILRQLSMKITNSQIDCREDYRQSLRQQLLAEKLTDSIIILTVKNWDASFYKPDGMHLNNKGYVSLDSCICNLIGKSRQE